MSATIVPPPSKSKTELAVNRQSVQLSADQLEEVTEVFKTIDKNGNGYIELSELRNALHLAGEKVPDFEVRQLIETHQKQGKGDKLDFDEFVALYKQFRSRDVSAKWTRMVTQADAVEAKKGWSEASNADIKHSIRNEEKVAFSDWINSNLSKDPDLTKNLPIDPQGEELYHKCRDGLVICKLINHAVSDTVDERALHKTNLNAYRIIENNTLALNSALAIGCNIVNIDADDLAKGKSHLILGLLWQIIRIGLFNQINLHHVPGLVNLLNEGETLDDLRKLSPEQILMRWVNYHLANAGQGRRLTNFTSDVKDSEIYTYLLQQIAPMHANVTLGPLGEQDPVKRAEKMLVEADKINCRAFVKPQDVVSGVYKLNLAFVANLFNTYPNLKPPEAEVDNEEETREEKTYRNWMNSMGVQPRVNYIYSDLCNGVIIFQLYEVIKPGIVDWKKVVRKFDKMKALMDQIQNCNYAVELGKQLRFSLIGIQGKDIYDGNQTLTLGLVWQLMRAYTLTVLSRCTGQTGSVVTDKEIVEWVNKKLSSSGKSSQIKSFQDSTNSTSKPLMELIDAIQPNTINWDVFKSEASDEAKLANAKYAISMARRIGAKVYALPEDIVEVKPKMVMTVFACLMARDYKPDMKTPVVSTDPVEGDLKE